MDILKLIDCIRTRTPLWNRKSPLYSARAMKKELWIEVVALTGATEDEVRRKWKCLNDIFRREQNKYLSRKKQDLDAEPPQWKYYSHMLFLESHIGTRCRGHTPKKTTSDTLVDMLREERDDHSLDSSLAFEDLTNFADVSIKIEVFDDNSLGYNEDDAEAIAEEISNSPNNEDAKKKRNQNGANMEESPTKRFKTVFNGHQQLIDANFQQNQSNVSQIDGSALSSEDIRKDPCTNKGVATFATNVTSEQHQFEGYKHMLEQIQQQQQKVQQQQHQNSHNNDDDDDDDYHFALSLVPAMRGLPKQRKMWLRLKIQQLLCEETELLMNAVNQPTNKS